MTIEEIETAIRKAIRFNLGWGPDSARDLAEDLAPGVLAWLMKIGEETEK